MVMPGTSDVVQHGVVISVVVHGVVEIGIQVLVVQGVVLVVQPQLLNGVQDDVHAGVVDSTQIELLAHSLDVAGTTGMYSEPWPADLASIIAMLGQRMC